MERRQDAGRRGAINKSRGCSWLGADLVEELKDVIEGADHAALHAAHAFVEVGAAGVIRGAGLAGALLVRGVAFDGAAVQVVDSGADDGGLGAEALVVIALDLPAAGPAFGCVQFGVHAGEDFMVRHGYCPSVSLKLLGW